MEPTGWIESEHPYAKFLHLVQKPARYLGGEFRSARKDWDATRIHVALAFPDLYEIGMSHLGLRILYEDLAAHSDIGVERVFAPWDDLERELRGRSLPLVTLENARAPADFDVVGFSLQYELTYTNVLNMLELSGIPLRSAARDNRWPLVVAGGPVATQPEPMAPFFDAFVIGDGEHRFEQLIRSYVQWRDEGFERPEILRRLVRLGGVYCPSLYATRVETCTGQQVVDRPLHEDVPRRVTRQIVPDLEEHPFPARGPVPSTQIVFDRFSMEIARGCTEGCRFCQAGIIYRPVRERKPDRIIGTLLEAVRDSGCDEVSLTALSTADFSCISPMVRKVMERLTQEKVSLCVSSLRAYGLPEELLESISDVRNTSLTFAPEAGSSRLRDVINKNVSEEDMEKSAHAVFSRGWSRCKLYFMIGLPTEEDRDVLDIVRTARRYLEIGKQYRRGRNPEITASVSNHVPKPHTPFQWVAMDGVDEILRKQRLLQKEAGGSRVKLKWHDAAASRLEAVLARGDRRVGDAIELAFRRGCRFDGWSQCFRYEVWLECFDELHIDPDVHARAVPLDARLPWDHIDVGVSQDFLSKEYGRALKARRSPPCGKPAGAQVHPTNLEEAAGTSRKLVCWQCGAACDLESMRQSRNDALELLGAVRSPPSAAAAGGVAGGEDLETIRKRNNRPRTAIVNQASTRYRFLYTKRGRARFLSHLDIVRMLPRLFRRSGLSLAYTLGFHPKPRMTFSPALPLGWASRGELLDAHVEGLPDCDDMLPRLNEAAPEGIEFLQARRLDGDDRGLSRVVRAADYTVCLGSAVSVEIVREGIAAVTSGQPFELVRRREAVEETVTIGPSAVLDVRFDEEPGALFLRTRVDLARAPRPDSMARRIAGVEPVPQAVERLALWCVDESGSIVSPLDLQGLRRSRPKRPRQAPSRVGSRRNL